MCKIVESKPMLNIATPIDFRRVLIQQTVEIESVAKPQNLNIKPNINQEQEQSYDQEDTQLFRQLKFLSLPFRQRVYQPIEFVMKDGTHLIGVVNEIDGTIIKIIDGRQEVLIEANAIDQLIWRGKPFPIV